MIDTVLSLLYFKGIMEKTRDERVTIIDDVRICVWTKSDQYFTKCQVIVSLGLYHPQKILRCIVSERIFSTIELESPHETPDKKKYKEWTKQTYDEVQKTLGFMPTEGFWEWGKEHES